MEIAAAVSFIRRLQSQPQLFAQFRRVMTDFSTQKMDVPAVVSELDTLFQFHKDLLNHYRFFLPPQFRPSSPSRQSRKSGVINADMKILKPCIDFMNKVHKRFADENGVIRAYLETVRALTQGKISNKDAYNAIVNMFGDENEDLVDEFELLLSGDNYMGRKRTKKKKSTSPSNSGDEEIKARKKRMLDDLNLSRRMEDEMFELDIHLSHVKTTMKSAMALMDSEEYQQHQEIKINNYFSAISLGCIRKEYKEQGCFVIELLREHPKLVLPLILKQLESKEKELVEAKEELHKYWRETLEQKKNSMTNSSV